MPVNYLKYLKLQVQWPAIYIRNALITNNGISAHAALAWVWEWYAQFKA